jgi:hypothetical protein
MSRLATNASRLERWLGKDTVEAISASMRDWYGPPILLGQTPSLGGGIVVGRGGDFRGKIAGGDFVGLFEVLVYRYARHFKRLALTHSKRMAAITSADDIYGGVPRTFNFSKTGTTGVVGVTNSLWNVGAYPAAGGLAPAAPGGRAPTDATTGAFPFANPPSGDDQVLTYAEFVANALSTLLAYDRIFDVSKTMNSTATEAVTGAPTRYQSTTLSARDSAEGNFLFVEVIAALAATAHNWTTCLYTDQAGNASTLPVLTGNSGAIVNRLDQPANQWFAPLEGGDSGIRTLTQMQCSAAVATGTCNFVIGHPLVMLPAYNVNGPGNNFDLMAKLAPVLDDACIAFLEVTKPNTTAATYSGFLTSKSN